MATATLTDVTNRLGRPLESEEQTLAETLLGDVELLISRRIADLSTVDPDVLVMVEARVVCRVLRNPEGISHQQADGFAYTLDKAVASGQLKLTDDEWYLLGVYRRYSSVAPKFRERG